LNLTTKDTKERKGKHAIAKIADIATIATIENQNLIPIVSPAMLHFRRPLAILALLAIA